MKQFILFFEGKKMRIITFLSEKRSYFTALKIIKDSSILHRCVSGQVIAVGTLSRLASLDVMGAPLAHW